MTGSPVGLATGLSGCVAGMFIRVNRSGFVQFCFSLYMGSVLGLVCSGLPGSFPEAVLPIGRGVLLQPSPQGTQPGGTWPGAECAVFVVYIAATGSRQQTGPWWGIHASINISGPH